MSRKTLLNELEDLLTKQTFRDSEEAQKVVEILILAKPIIERQMFEGNIPTLKGFVRRGNKGDLIFVWCPFCNCFHQHGLLDGHPAMKHHRVAHCFNPLSPFKITGYYIKPFNKRDMNILNIPDSFIVKNVRQNLARRRTSKKCRKI